MVPWYRRAGIWFGIGTGPGTFTVGGALSAGLPLRWLPLVIAFGAAVLAALAVAQAMVSRSRREASSARAVSSFGPNLGAVLLNLVVALGALGWFGFYAGLAGFAAANLLGLAGWTGSLLIVALFFAVYIIGIDRWNSFVWLTAVSTICVALFALHSAGTHLAPDHVARLPAGAFLWGAGSVVTYGLLFALRSGDFAWDFATSGDVVKSGLALFVPTAIFMLIGAIVYRTAGDDNIADVLARTQSPAVANLFLILSTIAPSMSGFHSANLVIGSTTRTAKLLGTALICLLGFVLGALRFDHELLLFLNVLGAFIAPALLVMLEVAFLGKGGRRVGALASWLLGSATGLVLMALGSASAVWIGAAAGSLSFLVWGGVGQGMRRSHETAR